MKEVIREEKKIEVIISNCGSHKGKNCCYIKFVPNKNFEYHHSDEGGNVVLDFNEKNELIGIEFISGVKLKK